MNEHLKFLVSRNSAPKLTSPGPDADELAQMMSAALRAPDHARLRPWRFLTVSGERREALGELLLQALLARNPDADESAQTKARNAPLRAPVVVVVICKLSEHPKVPHIEQRQSAACAAHGLLLGAEALGYSGIWRTGDVAFDRPFMTSLGLAADEEITGFVYLGTRDGKPKPLPEMNPEEFNQYW
ncbi:nitroreductase [Halioglobus japonicus]|uniref:Putative NAD(P)H nitroreductase n=1 Tax=Halioglobus japonicus TaxID=930805 RepID=A0AAP8MFN6_9GAMM|nr:nitroreductase [Halioglobus japonicus]AQA20245.1 nitroreductase [Halioglobus japonicus]PLW86996.1 nitroreductase [Halioglobus japonicus]